MIGKVNWNALRWRLGVITSLHARSRAFSNLLLCSDTVRYTEIVSFCRDLKLPKSSNIDRIDPT